MMLTVCPFLKVGLSNKCLKTLDKGRVDFKPHRQITTPWSNLSQRTLNEKRYLFDFFPLVRVCNNAGRHGHAVTNKKEKDCFVM